jgi:insulysin
MSLKILKGLFMNRRLLYSFLLISSFFISNLSASSSVPSKLGYQYIQDRQNLKAQSPEFQTREVEKLLLNNGLKTIIIHDPKAESSAFSLSVGTGMLDDPLQFPGMAHLIERVLLVASQKYPVEDEIFRFIKQNQGQLLSQTFLDRTVFSLKVPNAHLGKSIDRFAASLSNPDFSSSVLFRKIKGLDEAYYQFQQDQQWPLELIKQKLAKPSHPYANYFPGNISSLEGLLKKHAFEWFQKFYIPQNMHLVVISPLKIEEIKEQILTSFYPLKSGELVKKDSLGRIFPEENKGKKVFIFQKKLEYPQLVLSWELGPNYLKRAKAFNKVFKELFASNSEGSLFSLLKKEGLVRSLDTSLFSVGKENLLFEFQISLNQKGGKEQDRVVARCFQAIESFKRSGVPDYITSELSQLESLNILWPDRVDNLQESFHAAMELVDEDTASYPSRSHLVTPSSIDPIAVLSFLNELSPGKVNIYSMDSQETSLTPNLQTEPHTQSDYLIQEISTTQLTSLERVIPLANIFPRKANPYISSNQKIKTEVLMHDDEKILVEDDHAKIYHLALKDYDKPDVFWEFRIKTPLVSSFSSEDQIFLDLLISALKRQTSSLKHLANQAGMDFDFFSNQEGMLLTISGFSEKVSELLAELSYNLRSINITTKDFEYDKTFLFNRYRSATTSKPLVQAENILSSFLYKDFISEKEKAKGISNIKYIDFQKFTHDFFSKTFVEGLVMGNSSFEESQKLAKTFIQHLSKEPYLKSEQTLPEVIVLNPQRGPFSITRTIEHQDHGLILLLGHGSYEPKKYTSIHLLNKLLNEELKQHAISKSKLVTQAQSSLTSKEGQLFTVISLESPFTSSRDMLDHLEGFLDQFLQTLPLRLSQKEFKKQKEELLSDLSPSFPTLKEKGLFISSSVFEDKRSFDAIESEKESLHFFNIESLLISAKELYAKSNKKRLALLVEGILPKQTANYYKVVDDKKQMFQLNRFIKGKKTA